MNISCKNNQESDLDNESIEIPSLSNQEVCLIFSAASHHSSSLESKTENGCSLTVPMMHAKSSILPMRTRKTPKFTLVLDLDETLVHSEMMPSSTPDNIFKIKLNDSLYNIYVFYRPGLVNFLDSVCALFEVVIFTASMKPYAEQVLKGLDPHNRLKYKFYRDTCTELNGNYVKDLRLLGRDLSRVIIVDNSEVAFSFQPENGILIKSWFFDRDDRELENIQRFLTRINSCEDVRPLLQKSFCELSSKIDLF
jgi:CTD small phosphatase-like protein 2